MLLGVLAGFVSHWFAIPAVFSFAAAMVGSLYRVYGIGCPRCRGCFGCVISFSVNPFSPPHAVRVCPFRGVTFDAQLEAPASVYQAMQPAAGYRTAPQAATSTLPLQIMLAPASGG